MVFTGCQWRFLPPDFPKRQTVYDYFGKWQEDGIRRRIHEALRSDLRRKKGRHKHPTAGSIDSQSVKTTAVPSARGFDAGKPINGRKRHISVDTLGLILVVAAAVASVQDGAGAKMLCRRVSGSCKKLRRIRVDGGYRGELLDRVKKRFRFCLEVILRWDKQNGFVILPKRWIVERTFARLLNHRR